MSNILKFKKRRKLVSHNRVYKPWNYRPRKGSKKPLIAKLLALAITCAVVGVGIAYFPMLRALKAITDTPPNVENMMQGSASIIDGDTIRLGGKKIRLAGIDAPEYRQNCSNKNGSKYACGIQSTKQLKRLIGRNPVHCDKQALDQYKRVLAVCYAGEVNLNAEMVSTGWAIAYTYFSKAYILQQFSAQLNGLGIWQGEFQEPYQYRKTQSGKH